MIQIDIIAGYQNLIDAATLESAANATLEQQGQTGAASLSIVITDDEAVQALNLQYRGLNAPTDVLSFPAGFTDPESGDLYLGDVIIAYPKATDQAQKARHPVKAELILLVVHGVLHLLGHDHAEPEEKTQMWTAQTETLNKLGIDIQEINED